MAKESIGKRLEELRREARIETLQDFVDRLNAGREKRFPYATASRYHKEEGGREPPLEYVQRVAEVFGVLPQWLAFGIEPRTEAELRDEVQRAARARLARVAASDEALVKRIVASPSATPGVSEIARDYVEMQSGITSRRAALLRFARKLDDAEHPGASWKDEDVRAEILTAAHDFLSAVDDAMDAAGRVHPDAAEGSLERFTRRRWLAGGYESPGRRVEWEDAVLALFAARVVGLGAGADQKVASDA